MKPGTLRSTLCAFALPATLLFASACTPELKAEEVTGTLFKDKGQLGGYDFGDSWDAIMKDHDPKLKVRDDEFKQLRYDLTTPIDSGLGNNGFFITFALDDGKKVKSMSANIYGKKQNAVTVRKLLDDVIAHYDKSHTKGKCARTGGEGNSSHCSWPGHDGLPDVDVMYLEFKDPIGGQIDITVGPAQKK